MLRTTACVVLCVPQQRPGLAAGMGAYPENTLGFRYQQLHYSLITLHSSYFGDHITSY